MKKLLLSLSMVLFVVGFALAQKTVTGTITDTDGEPLIGASVLVKGTSSGTVTDIDGGFSLRVPETAEMLSVSYTGFANQDVLIDGRSAIDVVMEEGVALDEVVVTALGISREEKSLGYAMSEVGGEEIADSRETNVVNALQGKVAGIQIQGSPSTLGGSSRITIRGSSSFLGQNQPLFVVDGVPIDNSNFATNGQQRGFGGSNAYDYGNTAQDIDPNNIKSMSVLKGAAATALYGARGANGVILITTKDGSGQKGFGVEVNSSVGWDQVTNLIPHQQIYGGGDIQPTESGFNEVVIDGQTQLYPTYAKDGSWGPKFEGQLVRHWDSWDPQRPNFGELRPWVAPENGYEEFFETGMTFQNSVAVSGADEKGSFRLGYTNLNQSGTFPNAELDRNTVTFNSGYQLHPRLKVGISGNYVRNEAANRNVTGYNNGNPMQAFTQWWQTNLDLDRLRDASTYVDGTQYTWNPVGVVKDQATNEFVGFNPNPNFFDNPYWVRNNYLQEDVRDRIFGNFNASFELAEGLTLTGRLGNDFYAFSAVTGIPSASVSQGQYTETERRFNESNLEGRLNYNKDFGDISLSASLGGNRMRQFTRRTYLSTVGGVELPGFDNLSNSAGPIDFETEEFNKQINSAFGFASIGFRNFLYLDISGRNDWSSTLNADDNSYFYPAASLSAVISDIPGLGNLGPLSFAKVRLSYAQAGNDADPYLTTNVFDPQVPGIRGNTRYNVPNTLPNQLLANELTKEIEAGLNVRFLNNRIGLDVAYYKRNTTEQIFNVPVSAATGFTARALNAGEMENSGVELSLNVTPVSTRDFTWDLYFNATSINNKVVSLDEGVESIARGGTWAADLRVAEDVGYMALFGQDFVRENYEEDADGNIIRNEGQPTVNENGEWVQTADRVFLGSAVADYIGGFGTNFTYKGINLGVLFDFQEGGIVHSTSLQWAKYSGMHPETISFNGVEDIRETGLILPGVKADGTPNDIAIDPQTYYQNTFRFAAPNVFDASFLKLREVRLGYTLPNTIFGGSTFRDMRISLFGRNLAVLSSDLPYLDPQQVNGAGNEQGLENAQVPSTRSFGINLTFRL